MCGRAEETRDLADGCAGTSLPLLRGLPMRALPYTYVSCPYPCESMVLTFPQPKMTYASSKEGLRRALNGVGAEVQANREDDIEYDSMLKDITRGKR